MIGLICIDVDGTLVGTDGKIPDAVWAAAERVRARGVRMAICSGRAAFGTARGYAERLDPTGWHVFQNGASVVHLPSGTSKSTPIAPAIVTELIAASRANHQVLELYADVAWAVESTLPRAAEHAKMLGVELPHGPLEGLRDPVVRAQWVVPTADAASVQRAPAGTEVTQSTSPMMADTTFVLVTAEGVSKASAIEVVAAQYGVAMTEVMHVGDGHNDLAALRVVGWPVAMGNGVPEVRAAAKRVVGDVDAGGLAEALDYALTL